MSVDVTIRSVVTFFVLLLVGVEVCDAQYSTGRSFINGRREYMSPPCYADDANAGEFVIDHQIGKGSKQSPPSTLFSWKWIVWGVIAGTVVDIFSTYFPFVADPTLGVVAPKIYVSAFWKFDERSVFDNSMLTYGTDYFIAVVMTAWAFSFRRRTKSLQHRADLQATMLRAHHFRSQGLLLSYAISVLAGAISHQFFTSVEMRNTWAFRLLWTTCVGSVTAAAGWMGSIASTWAHLDEDLLGDRNWIPVLPGWFWAAFQMVGTTVVILGGWSYQRPACDIFIAGISQMACSFYCVAIMWKGLLFLPAFSASHRRARMIAFVLNAPLLPLYPYLVSTNLSLGETNAILHSCLCFTWSFQAIVLRQVGLSLVEALTPPPHAVPIKKLR